MKTIQGKVKFIVVPVPANSQKFMVKYNSFLGMCDLRYYIKNKSQHLILEVNEATIIGKLSELTEEQCADITHKFNNGACRDYRIGYFAPDDDSLDFVLTAKDSIKSLLQSNGLNLKSWIFDKISSNSNELYAYKDIVSEAAEDYLIILID